MAIIRTWRTFLKFYMTTAPMGSSRDTITYERFAPQNPRGKADPLGIRQFIAGTGGANLYDIGTIKPNSEVRNTTAHGVLKFTLHPRRYVWEFIPIAGQEFRDSGTAQCSMQATEKRRTSGH